MAFFEQSIAVVFATFVWFVELVAWFCDDRMVLHLPSNIAPCDVKEATGDEAKLNEHWWEKLVGPGHQTAHWAMAETGSFEETVCE